MLSATATGEGDMDLIGRLNRDGEIYLSRSDTPHESLLTVRHYKYIRMTGEMTVVGKEGPSGAASEVVGVAQGSSRLRIVILYPTQIPVRASIKIPTLFRLIALVIRTIGIGDFTPIWSILRA